MADSSVTANPGTGGAVFDTDEIASEHIPLGKLVYGAYGTKTFVTSTNGFPIQNDDTDLSVEGSAAENAAAAGNPVLTGGRYDLTPRTLGDGDVGAIALDADGAVHISDGGNTITVDGTVTANPASGTIDTVTTVSTVTAVTDITNTVTVDNAGTFSVQASSVVPGTGATNLGKAIDSAVGSTDTGVALLGKHLEDQIHLSSTDGDYNVISMDSLGSLHVNAEAHHVFDTFNATTGWTVLGNDTLNLATTKKHVSGTDALSFDKVDGAANTVFAGIQKTLSSTDLGAISPHDIIQGSFYLSSIADIDYIFCRLGTDSSNYNEWRLDGTQLTAGIFETGALTIGDASYDGITGNGWDPSAVTYIACGAAFNSQTDTLSGIIFDEVSYHTNQHSSTSINSEVTSSINSANVNINKVGNQVTDAGAGAVGSGTLRVTLGSDDPAVTSLELIDDTVFADSAAFTLGSSKVNVQGGVFQSGTPTTLTDNDAGAILLNSTAGQMVELMAGSASIGTLGANSGVDIGDVDVTSITGVTMSNAAIQTTGDEAHDAVDAGNPIKIGAYATASVEGLTEVAEADRTNLVADLNGVLITRQDVAPQELISTSQSVTTTTSTAATNFGAPGAGKHNYITSVTIFNSHASTNTHVLLQDGSGGTTRWVLPAPATGGVTHNFSPPLKQTTANTALYFAAGAAVTTIYVSIAGYQGDG
jgi:hypothetical protein